MIESEFDAEIWGWKWMAPGAIREAQAESPEQYTHWLRCCFAKVLAHLARTSGSGRGPAAPP